MAQKPKMLTCTCGNTELDKLSVRLTLSDSVDGKSLPLVALICGGSGCGRVTFRPDEAAKTEEEPAKIKQDEPRTSARPDLAASTNGHGPKRIAALFERIYKERLVYKAIAERDPNCPKLFEALQDNPQVCAGITHAFGQIYQRIDANEDLLAALQTLPSMASQR